MTRTLILMRHAKSSWSDPSADDFDRPLNSRGERSAEALGAWLGARDLSPGEVLVSGARRTVDTWAGIARVLKSEAPMRSDPALYLAAPPSMLAVLRGAAATKVLMIGHNPGICELAHRLVQEPPTHDGFATYPTGATTVITFEADTWRDIEYDSGTADQFIVPRELTS